MTVRSSDSKLKDGAQSRHPRSASAGMSYSYGKAPKTTRRKEANRRLPHPSENHLRMYLTHFHPFYPICQLRDLSRWIPDYKQQRSSTERHQHSEAPSGEPRELKPSVAVVCLVLTLGEAYDYKIRENERVTDARGQPVAFKSIYNQEDFPTIGSHDKTDLRRAQQLLLAGQCKELIGCSTASAEFFIRADTVLECLLKSNNLLSKEGTTELLIKSKLDVYSDAELVREKLKERSEVNEEKMADNSLRLIVMAAWTCLRLLRNNFPTDYKQTTGLWRIESLMPTLSEFSGKSVSRVDLPYQIKGSTMIPHFYQALTSIERLLDQIRGASLWDDTCSPPGQALQTLRERCREDIKKWEEILPNDLRWNRQSALHLNPMRARLEETYRKTMCEIDGCLPEEASHRCQPGAME